MDLPIKKRVDDDALVGMLIAYVQEYVDCSSNQTIEQLDRESIIGHIFQDLFSRGVAKEWEL